MARLVGLPDLHVADPGPSTRQDNVLETQMEILHWIEDTYRPDAYLAPGDLGDKRRWTNKAAIAFATWLKKVKVVVGCRGQHDMQSHSVDTFEDSSDLAILAAAASNLYILGDYDSYSLGDGTVIEGIDWGSSKWDKVLEGEFEMKGNILICHAPVTTGDHPGSVNPRSLEIEGEGFIVFGDIHKGFKPLKLPANKKITAMAGGVLTPMKANEAEFECYAYLIDTDDNTVTPIPIWEGREWEFTESAEITTGYSSAEFVESLDASIDSMEKDMDTRDYVRAVAKAADSPDHALRLVLDELNNE